MAASADPAPVPTRWAGATDDDVIRALAARDEEAVRELHRRYGRAVYALAFRVGTTSADMDVQKAFLAMVRQAATAPQGWPDARLWILGTAYQTLCKSTSPE
ncbi:hypothetical protein E7T09_15705 [Deinococcus sp. KSM4-11]|uniref:hypothetical protein n=1 Tax=Deinococcus sp. KSM4-11 TaxID=2568654 RepID=UPI0010A4DA09|nr:hypothetical protein [Deinococcus sp. KSM4-11]THF85415.1 hypothetical protein E7T09_15705 [Deinococcus sp. KSM4-11]